MTATTIISAATRDLAAKVLADEYRDALDMIRRADENAREYPALDFLQGAPAERRAEAEQVLAAFVELVSAAPVHVQPELLAGTDEHRIARRWQSLADVPPVPPLPTEERSEAHPDGVISAQAAVDNVNRAKSNRQEW